MISSSGGISSYNIALDASGHAGLTSASDTLTKTTTSGTTTTTNQSGPDGVNITESITTNSTGGFTGLVTITYAAGTSPTSSTVISPH